MLPKVWAHVSTDSYLELSAASVCSASMVTRWLPPQVVVPLSAGMQRMPTMWCGMLLRHVMLIHITNIQRLVTTTACQTYAQVSVEVRWPSLILTLRITSTYSHFMRNSSGMFLEYTSISSLLIHAMMPTFGSVQLPLMRMLGLRDRRMPTKKLSRQP